VRKKKKRGKSAYGAELLLAADADGALRRPEPSEQPDGAVRHHPSPSTRADAEAAVVPLMAPVRRRRSDRHVACCLLHVACCVLYAACCMIHSACCIVHVACCNRQRRLI
jgi:hypothetical protein